MHPATTLLLTHKARLSRVIAANADVWNVNAAKRMLRRVEWALSLPVVDGPWGTEGMFGPNGYGPAIDDICATAERLKGKQELAA